MHPFVLCKMVGLMKLHIEKSKQVEKYLKRLDSSAREKLDNAIDGLKEGKGDIVKLKGKKYVSP